MKALAIFLSALSAFLGHAQAADSVRAFIYQVWTPMEAGQVPPSEKLPDWAKGKEKLRNAEFPMGEDVPKESMSGPWLRAPDWPGIYRIE